MVNVEQQKIKSIVLKDGGDGLEVVEAQMALAMRPGEQKVLPKERPKGAASHGGQVKRGY